MSIPEPCPGLVIRYNFLWSHEFERGALDGSKDRPSAIVVATSRSADGLIRTIVAPITHVPHKDFDASLEIPREVCRALGLDNERQWLRFDELNSFLWPGYDLRKRPGSLNKYDYGLLPKNLFEQLKHGILSRQRKLKPHIVSRDD